MFTDPLGGQSKKSLEAIGANLQKQYERWQPRARSKLSLDPTLEEVKKLCQSLRRNAKVSSLLINNDFVLQFFCFKLTSSVVFSIMDTTLSVSFGVLQVSLKAFELDHWSLII